MRRRRAVCVGLVLIALAAVNVAVAPYVQRRFVTPSYLAFSYDSVDGMDPTTQSTGWVRRRMTDAFSLYLAIGEFPGSTVLVAPDVTPEPQYLFGFGRVERVGPLDRTPSRSSSSDCTTRLSGTDRRLGSFELCLRDGRVIEMFRSDDVVVVQDASVS